MKITRTELLLDKLYISIAIYTYINNYQDLLKPDIQYQFWGLVLKSFFLFVGIARSYYTILHDYLHLLAHKNGNRWNCDKPFKR